MGLGASERFPLSEFHRHPSTCFAAWRSLMSLFCFIILCTHPVQHHQASLATFQRSEGCKLSSSSGGHAALKQEVSECLQAHHSVTTNPSPCPLMAIPCVCAQDACEIGTELLFTATEARSELGLSVIFIAHNFHETKNKPSNPSNQLWHHPAAVYMWSSN